MTTPAHAVDDLGYASIWCLDRGSGTGRVGCRRDDTGSHRSRGAERRRPGGRLGRVRRPSRDRRAASHVVAEQSGGTCHPRRRARRHHERHRANGVSREPFRSALTSRQTQTSRRPDTPSLRASLRRPREALRRSGPRPRFRARYEAALCRRVMLAVRVGARHGAVARRRGRVVGSEGPGVSRRKSRLSGCEPVTRESESFVWVSARGPLASTCSCSAGVEDEV